MALTLEVIDRLDDLHFELGKVNGLLATIGALGSSGKDGPSSDELMNMLRLMEDVVSPAYGELTAIVEEVGEEYRASRNTGRNTGRRR